jgi:hypothetical protein
MLPSDVPTKILYTFLIPSMRATRAAAPPCIPYSLYRSIAQNYENRKVMFKCSYYCVYQRHVTVTPKTCH